VWEDELAQEGITSIERLTRAKTNKLQQVLGSSSQWFLLNYEGLRTCKLLTEVQWDMVICDESTRIRSPRAQITQLITKGFRNTRYKAVLSGMPAPESPLDYFTQFVFLHGEFLKCYNYWQFRQRYFDPDARGWQWNPRNGTVAAIREEVHRLSVVMTHRQAGIGPKRIYSKRYVEMTPEQRQEYRRIQKDFEAKFPDGSIRATPWVVVQVNWLSRVAGGFHPEGSLMSDSKIRELVQLLKTELRDEQVLVWFRFNAEIRAVIDALRREKVEHFSHLTGLTPGAERERVIREFREEKLRVLLIQMKIGKFALNLSTSSTAIYFSNTFEMEDRAQSEERILDPRKNEPLLYIDLITQDSLDEVTLSALKNKKVNAKFFMSELVREWGKRYRENREC
jgi:SNF2 family DNA or RNA helicase